VVVVTVRSYRKTVEKGVPEAQGGGRPGSGGVGEDGVRDGGDDGGKSSRIRW